MCWCATWILITIMKSDVECCPKHEQPNKLRASWLGLIFLFLYDCYRGLKKNPSYKEGPLYYINLIYYMEPTCQWTKLFFLLPPSLSSHFVLPQAASPHSHAHPSGNMAGSCACWVLLSPVATPVPEPPLTLSSSATTPLHAKEGKSKGD